MEKNQILEFIESDETGRYIPVLAGHIDEVQKMKFKSFLLFLFSKYGFSEKEKEKIREKHWGFRQAFNNYKSRLTPSLPSRISPDHAAPVTGASQERFREPGQKSNVIPKI